MLARQISLRTSRSALWQPEIPNSRVGRDEISDPVCAVIDNDQFLIRVVLAQKIMDRALNERPTVECRHDTGDQGQMARRRSFHSRVRDLRKNSRRLSRSFALPMIPP